MESFNSEVNAVHQAFKDSTGWDLPLSAHDEQRWLYAIRVFNVTPDDVKLVVKERIRLIARQERRTASIYLRNLIGTLGDQDGPLAEFQMELAAIRARMRKPVHDSGKVVVLEATGRPTEPEQPPARSIGEVLEAMRKAAT